MSRVARLLVAGETEEEALQNIVDAIQEYLAAAEELAQQEEVEVH